MGKTSKATKNFSKNHLQDDLKQRRQKKKIQFRDKKKWTGTKTPEQLALEKAKKKGTELPCEGSDSSEEEEEEDAAGGISGLKTSSSADALGPLGGIKPVAKPAPGAMPGSKASAST
eukprot:CAMPEP_0180309500 /NCGR_PEP_ID=MMETSP0988-20121125/29149_1 /TAXON_ID=697907 /ORGANISM="non described non described, Strain CCMP2293" /LENGTH=116 /DNA_ID=CAMNT_0022293317 /DNA_START=86 /DNA_END=432 /DNA_ORIENTATION=+